MVEQAKFEYSPLRKVFNKGLEGGDEKVGLLNRLKNIEGKTKEQLKAIKDQGKKQIDAIKKNKQLEVGKKDDKTKSIVYLKERINKLVDLYPNSFNSKSIIFLKSIKNYEIKIKLITMIYLTNLFLLKKILLDLTRLIFF